MKIEKFDIEKGSKFGRKVRGIAKLATALSAGVAATLCTQVVVGNCINNLYTKSKVLRTVGFVGSTILSTCVGMKAVEATSGMLNAMCDPSSEHAEAEYPEYCEVIDEIIPD